MKIFLVVLFLVSFGLVLILVPNVSTEPATLSSTLYLPRIVHVPVDSCKTMFPPAEVGPLCEFYDGINLPDDCAAGYHLEGQKLPGFERVDPYPHDARPLAYVGATGANDLVIRKVCHLDSGRGERGLGLDCANPKGTP